MSGWTPKTLKEYVDQRFARLERDAEQHHAEDQHNLVRQDVYEARHAEIETALSIIRDENIQRREYVDTEIQKLREEQLASRERLAGAEQSAREARMRQDDRERPWDHFYTRLGIAAAVVGTVAFLIVNKLLG
jgi:hypothetical protein